MTHGAPAVRSLVDVLRERAAAAGDAVAHRFLREGLEVTDQVTYAALDRAARAGAALLAGSLSPGDRVLLIYPPGLDFLTGFFSALYAGAIPVPAYPPHPRQSDARLRAIVADARPAVALASPEFVTRLEEASEGRAPVGPALEVGDGLPALPCRSIGDAPPGAAESWRPPALGRSDLSHLQYTSGSTAVPKGVMVTHGNVLSNLADLDEGWRHDRGSTIVSWLPPFHDMGLVYGLLMPIYAAIPGVLLPPVVFLQRPLRWLQAISRFGGTHSAAPNFAYDHCSRRVRPADLPGLDLSRWAVAVNGAEPVRGETMDRFCAAFEGVGFRRAAFAPGYGLAEATLKVTAMRRDDGPVEGTFDGRRLVSCGAPICETRIAIVDPETGARLPERVTGEVWVGGPSVAAGYWGRTEESAATFAAVTATGEGPYLKTGDLGFVSGGALYIAGRLKDLLIVRGQNYYPQDIETTVEESGARLRRGFGAAFSVVRDGEERLVVAYEVDRGLDPADAAHQVDLVRAAIARDHDLHAEDVVLLAIGGAPKTSSGKIQRRACRAAYLDGSLERWRGQPAVPPAPSGGGGEGA